MAASEPSAFGVLLRRHRIDAGLTQEEIAEQAELSARLVSDLERGVTQAPQRHTIQKLADALRLSEEDRARFRESARRRRSRKEAFAEQVPHGIDLLGDPTPFLGRESETAALVQLLQR
ncbi:MAG TPA: helix-turn-helix transcriptional regulator, partial [Chloroflexota bacterium]